MSALELARWQFGVVTVYHFIFVPVTIGITWFVALFQTLWYRRHEERYLRLTRFFGKLMPSACMGVRLRATRGARYPCR
jgi:cytochrome bd ubiquinol oxidase subunit I